MTTSLWYSLVGAALLGIGFHSLILTANVFRKIIALNIMGNGTFLVLVALAKRVPDLTAVVPDPVPQAMVLTGVVVSVSATALALALLLRYYEATGSLTLPEDDLSDTLTASPATGPASAEFPLENSRVPEVSEIPEASEAPEVFRAPGSPGSAEVFSGAENSRVAEIAKISGGSEAAGSAQIPGGSRP